MSLLAATQQQFIWKDDEMRRFARALVRAALRLSDEAEFTTDLVPAAERGNGRGIAGSITNALCAAGILRPAGLWQGETFYHKQAKSTRPGANSRKIGVYGLGNRALARKWLNENSADGDPVEAGTPSPEPKHSHMEQ